MKSGAKLDRLDWRILYELDCDGFESFARIGKKLGIGRDTIHYRVKRLEELGVIKKYLSIIDYSKMGYVVGALYLKLQHETPEIRREIVDYYRARKEIWWLLDMTPNFDIAFGWFGRNLIELRETQRALLQKYKKYFHGFKFREYVHHYHFRRDYLAKEAGLERRFPTITVEGMPQRITDETDEKILKILSDNARKPYVEIADELGLSAAQVHYRINSLKKKKVLLGARPMIDLEKIGYQFFKLDIYLDDYSVYEKVRDFVFSLPNVVYSYDVVGGADIELDVEISGYQEFMKMQDSIKRKFGSAISYTEYYQFKEEYKLKYFPPL